MITVIIDKNKFKSVEKLAGTSKYLVNLEPKEEGDKIYAYQIVLDYKPSTKEMDKEAKALLDTYKATLLKTVETYDKSKLVNVFYVNNTPHWLDKATRTGLYNSFNIQDSLGKGTVNLYLDETVFALPISKAKEIISQIEMYALSVFEITELHKKNIREANTLREVLEYSYSSGYPEVLSFTID